MTVIPSRWLYDIIEGHEVKSDGRSVWVTAPTGYTIGRFGPGGIDVHTAGADGCLDCVAGPGPHDWNRFVESMRLHHGLEIPAEFDPHAWRERVP